MDHCQHGQWKVKIQEFWKEDIVDSKANFPQKLCVETIILGCLEPSVWYTYDKVYQNKNTCMHIAHNSFIKKIMYIRKHAPFVNGHMYMDMDVILVSTPRTP